MPVTCHRVLSQLPALQDGELAPDQELLIRGHVQGCARCQLALGALEAVSRGLVKDAAWQPPSGQIAMAAIQAAANAAPSQPVSGASRILRFAPAVAAAAAVLALATVVTIRLANRPSTPEPIDFIDAPRVVVDRPAAMVPSPVTGEAAPTMVAAGPVADVKHFELGADGNKAPVGRAFVVCDGQVRAYEGPVTVTIDTMPSGPAALRVDAFPRERKPHPKASSRRL